MAHRFFNVRLLIFLCVDVGAKRKYIYMVLMSDIDICMKDSLRNSIKIINFVGDVGVMTLQNSKLWIFIERQ